jgi:hypothetical protein
MPEAGGPLQRVRAARHNPRQAHGTADGTADDAIDPKGRVPRPAPHDGPRLCERRAIVLRDREWLTAVACGWHRPSAQGARP